MTLYLSIFVYKPSSDLDLFSIKAAREPNLFDTIGLISCYIMF